jgi:O-antigen/teichoic acid export membrane protein
MALKRIFTPKGDRRSTVINTAGALVGQALLALTGVMLARSLGPTDRGYVALLILIPTIMFQAGGLGVPLSVTFALARDPRSGPIVRAYIRRIGGIQLFVLMPLSAIALGLVVINDPVDVRLAALMAPLIFAAGMAQQYGAAVLQGVHRFFAYNLIFLSPLALYALGLGILLIADAMTVAAATGVYVGALSVGGAAGLAMIRELGPESTETEAETSSMLRFGIRGMLGSPDSVEALRIDQAIVGLLLTPAALGNYAVALSFTNLPRFVARGVGRVAYPRVAEQTTMDAARTRMWRFFWEALPLYGAVCVGIWVAAPELVRFFFGSAFAESADILRILLVSTLLISARLVLSEGARGTGYPTVPSIAELVSLVVLLASAAILVPSDGVDGVAWALVASSGAGLAALIIGLAYLRGRPGLEPTIHVPEPPPAEVPIDA